MSCKRLRFCTDEWRSNKEFGFWSSAVFGHESCPAVDSKNKNFPKSWFIFLWWMFLPRWGFSLWHRFKSQMISTSKFVVSPFCTCRFSCNHSILDRFQLFLCQVNIWTQRDGKIGSRLKNSRNHIGPSNSSMIWTTNWNWTNITTLNKPDTSNISIKYKQIHSLQTHWAEKNLRILEYTSQTLGSKRRSHQGTGQYSIHTQSLSWGKKW